MTGQECFKKWLLNLRVLPENMKRSKIIVLFASKLFQHKELEKERERERERVSNELFNM